MPWGVNIDGTRKKKQSTTQLFLTKNIYVVAQIVVVQFWYTRGKPALLTLFSFQVLQEDLLNIISATWSHCLHISSDKHKQSWWAHQARLYLSTQVERSRGKRVIQLQLGVSVYLNYFSQKLLNVLKELYIFLDALQLDPFYAYGCVKNWNR